MSAWRRVRAASLSPLRVAQGRAQGAIVMHVDLAVLTRCDHAGITRAVPQDIASSEGILHFSRVAKALDALAAFRTASSPDPQGRVLVWDPDTFVAYIPGWLAYDRPRNPGQAIARLKWAAVLPDCAPKTEMLKDLRAFIKAKGWKIDERTYVTLADEDEDHGADAGDARVDGGEVAAPGEAGQVGERAGAAGPVAGQELGMQQGAAAAPAGGGLPAPAPARTVARGESLRDAHGALLERYVTPVRAPAAAEPPPAAAGDRPCWWPIVESYRRELNFFPQPSDPEVRRLASELDAAWARATKPEAWRAYFALVASQARGLQLLAGERGMVNVKLGVLLQPDVARAVYAERDRRRTEGRDRKAKAAAERAAEVATGPPEAMVA